MLDRIHQKNGSSVIHSSVNIFLSDSQRECSYFEELFLTQIRNSLHKFIQDSEIGITSRVVILKTTGRLLGTLQFCAGLASVGIRVRVRADEGQKTNQDQSSKRKSRRSYYFIFSFHHNLSREENNPSNRLLAGHIQPNHLNR